MDLKDFIIETMSAIADATSTLQDKYTEDDILINPPTSLTVSDAYKSENWNYTARRVQNVQFDVAVTASTETSGVAKAGIKVLSLDVGAKGEKSASAEQVSRVSFQIPITLRPTSHENINEEKRKQLLSERLGNVDRP